MQSYFNFHGNALLSVLALLGTGALLMGAAAGCGLMLLRGRTYAASRIGYGAAIVGGGYAAALLAVSVASSERLAGPGEEKYFCEIDCHLAYSVVGVERVDELAGARADGVFQVVRLRARFDPHTISPRRGDAPLRPSARHVWLEDASGRRWRPSEDAREALAAVGGDAFTSLDRPLRPGEFSTTALVFDVPADARPTRLVVTEAGPATRLLIGHENSPFHAKTAFRLSSATYAGPAS